MIESAAVTLTTAPSLVSSSQLDPSGDDVAPHTVTVQVPQNQTAVVVGAAGVTTSTGLLISPGQVLTLDLDRNERLYARTIAGESTIRVLRNGVNDQAVKTRALILAGNGRKSLRWPDEPPRHLVPIKGEPLIHRTIRMLAERNIPDIRVFADSTDTDYVIPPGIHEIPRVVDRDWTQEWEPSQHMWNPEGRTIILYGDCYFSDRLLDFICLDSGDPWTVYARYDGSPNTGKAYGEMFGWVFDSKHAPELTRCQQEAIAWKMRGDWNRALGWEVYRIAMGKWPGDHYRGKHFYSWDDSSEDFDMPADYETWARLNPDLA